MGPLATEADSGLDAEVEALVAGSCIAAALGHQSHQVADGMPDVAQLLEVTLEHATVLGRIRRPHQRDLGLSNQVLQRRAELVREPAGEQPRALLLDADVGEHVLERLHELRDLGGH